MGNTYQIRATRKSLEFERDDVLDVTPVLISFNFKFSVPEFLDGGNADLEIVGFDRNAIGKGPLHAAQDIIHGRRVVVVLDGAKPRIALAEVAESEKEGKAEVKFLDANEKPIAFKSAMVVGVIAGFTRKFGRSA